MAHLIAIVLGALIGVAGDGGFGALVGALLGWLLLSVWRQRAQIEALRATLVPTGQAVTLAHRAVVPSASPDFVAPWVELDPLAPQPLSASAKGFAPEAMTNMAPSIVAPDAVIAPVIAMPMSEVPTAAGHPLPPAGPSAWEPIRRWLVGGNTIVKSGIAILFVGLAFLAKYAAEHTHLPPEVRLASIGVVAIALLAVGWRLRNSRPGYAQVLQGGAVAVLYLTLFAAFRFYGVLAAAPAFALMVVVAGLAAALAVLQDARSLAVVGALGGFATPLIVSTGSDNAAVLFACYFVLDAGIAAIAWFKTWRPLNLVGFVATFVIATAWGVLRYRPDAFVMSESYLVAFFLLFVLIMLLPARRATVDTATPRGNAWVNSSLLFGLPTVTFALQYGLVRDTPFGTALSALALAAFYVFLATWMKKRPELGITFDASLAIAVIFLTLVIPFALDARSTAGAWTLEGAGLVWIGFRQGRGLPRAFGYLLHFIAGLSMLLAHDRYGEPTHLFNAYLFNGLMAAAAALASAFFIYRQKQAATLADGEETAEPLLVAMATLWLASTAALELFTFVAWPFALAATLTAASAIVLLYVLIAARLDWPTIAWPTLAHAPLLFVAAAIDAAGIADPLRDGGWWAWPVAVVVHAAVLRWAAPRWPRVAADAVHAIGLLALALVGALIGRALTAYWGDAASAWPWLGWLAVPAALLLVLPRPATLRLWPMRAAPGAYARGACGVLAVALGVWTLVANFASDGSAQPLPHVPLINPLDLGIALALVAIVLWLRFAERAEGWPLAGVAAAGFIWLNAMLVRAFHHYGGVPYHIDAWSNSLAVQTGITLLWTTTALISMWVAAHRAARLPWVAGAVLLAAVVLKLLLVDLSGSGTVTRIVSFIGVGLLMLIIGYVAPLPAKESCHAPV
ncbi:MAG: DUF2339 domain-containing protein [Caldimonas sp.]